MKVIIGSFPSKILINNKYFDINDPIFYLYSKSSVMEQVYPVIVVPGITATYLDDHYLLPPETVWSVLTKKFGQVALHPDQVRYEALEPARVQSGQIYEIAYRELIQELRHNLSASDENPVPVYPFSYDWRQPLERVEEILGAFINEVIERTRLMRHYHDDWFLKDPKVNLVGHSMGGLIIAGYLEKHAKNHRVDKVVTLATPFGGSFEAVIKLATGTADLGTTPPGSREREAARVTPSLYYLLPDCEGVEAPGDVNPDLFDPAVWQPSIVETIRQYVEKHSVTGGDDAEKANLLFSGFLQSAREHRLRIWKWKLETAGLKSEDWLCIAGVNSTTRVGVKIDRNQQGLFFDFNRNDRKNEWPQPESDRQMLTGDGTVPLRSAIPGFLDPANIVCLSPDDFGYWEIQDRATEKLAGFHGLLPNMNVIHRLIVRHFTGRADRYRNTWGRSLPGIGMTQWKPPFDLFRRTD